MQNSSWIVHYYIAFSDCKVTERKQTSNYELLPIWLGHKKLSHAATLVRRGRRRVFASKLLHVAKAASVLLHGAVHHSLVDPTTCKANSLSIIDCLYACVVLCFRRLLLNCL